MKSSRSRWQPSLLQTFTFCAHFRRTDNPVRLLEVMDGRECPSYFRLRLCCARFFILVLLAVFARHCVAQSEARHIRQVSPRSGQLGRHVQVTITGGRLNDAQEVLFYSPGLTAVDLKPSEDGEVLQATIRIDPDCRIGEHTLRIRTTEGLTTMHTFYVGPLRHISEQESSTTFEAPQSIPLNVTVDGMVSAVGEVDVYRVQCSKGDPLVVEMQAVRLAQRLFDGYVAIHDQTGRVIADSDDTGLGHQDPIARCAIPVDGMYSIAVREAGFGNEGDYKGPKGRYLLHVGTFPRPLSLIPAGGAPGQPQTFHFLGEVDGDRSQTIPLPGLTATNFGMAGVVARRGDLVAPTPNPIRVSSLTNVLESEPNDATDQVLKAAIELPAAFNGVLSQNGDVDTFRFRAGQGQRFTIQVYARRIWSRLDSVLSIHRADGTELAACDDITRHERTAMFRYNVHNSGWYAQDSLIRWTVPEDGEYFVRVRDQLKKGGVDYHYRIEAAATEPGVFLWVKRDPPYWRGTPGQTISVPRGNRYAALLTHRKFETSDPLQVQPVVLPEGVSFSAPQLTDHPVPMLFEAQPDAPLAASLTRFRGRNMDGSPIVSTFEQTVYYGLNPPNYCFYGVDNDRLAVAVAQDYPVRLELTPPQNPLPQNGVLTLKVIVETELTKPHPPRISMLYNPPGVSSNLTERIKPGRHTIEFPLEADREAKTGEWPIAIISRVAAQLRGGGISTTIETLRVVPAYLDGEIERTVVKQGSKAAVICRLDQKTAFDGPATIRLRGLPEGVRSVPQRIDSATSTVSFEVTADASATVGTHATLSCEVAIGSGDDPVIQRVAQAGVLVIQE